MSTTAIYTTDGTPDHVYINPMVEIQKALILAAKLGKVTALCADDLAWAELTKRNYASRAYYVQHRPGAAFETRLTLEDYDLLVRYVPGQDVPLRFEYA